MLCELQASCVVLHPHQQIHGDIVYFYHPMTATWTHFVLYHTLAALRRQCVLYCTLAATR